MAILDDIDSWLITGSITDVFLSYLPEGDGLVRAVIETPASAPMRVFKDAGNAVSFSRLQVMSRSADYKAARAGCQAVIDRIIAIADETISGTTYMSASTVNDPFLLQRDDNGRSLVVGSVELVFTT